MMDESRKKKSFFELIEERIRETESLLCVGLDPHPEDLARMTARSARDFSLNLIDDTKDLAVAYKPNAAFFEAMGSKGWDALLDVIEAIPTNVAVILDAKRGDIDSTARAYATSTFEVLGANAITLNPYLGYTTMRPFLENPARGVFLLCKTSNPGAGDLQDLPLAGEVRHFTLYEKVAMLAQRWNANNNLGLVVGATDPAAIRNVRKVAPDLWILAPGVGFQGGDLSATLQAGLWHDGMGLLIPVSRGISRAPDMRKAAIEINEQIKQQRKQIMKEAKEPLARRAGIPSRLADGLLKAGCIKFGNFTLKSGIVSPFYVDLRQLVTYPDILAEVSSAYLPILRSLKFDRIAAIPYAALPIATTISIQTGWPMIYPRKESKGYGTAAEIEGEFKPGERVVVIDDLATTGGSKFEVIQKLTDAGLIVEDVVILIDRQSGAAASLKKAGYNLHAVLKFSDMLNQWEHNGLVDRDQINTARAFLSNQNIQA